MNSKEFVQACEDGKTLVWGHEGKRVVSRSKKGEKKLYYHDTENAFTIVFDGLERCGDNYLFITRKDDLIGTIHTSGWEIFGEVKE